MSIRDICCAFAMLQVSLAKTTLKKKVSLLTTVYFITGRKLLIAGDVETSVVFVEFSEKSP